MKEIALLCTTVVLCVALCAYTQYLIFFVTPLDAVLFFNQKIFYYHVPCAFMLFLAVILCGLYSLSYLRRRQPARDEVAKAAGELAVVFGAIMLVTGSIWAKVAWEKWWVWDARLTSALLLWMAMVAYVLVRKYGGLGSERLAAGMGIFAAINIPLVYGSVKIWETRHPQTSAVPALTGTMRTALWASVLLFLLVFLLMLHLQVRRERALRRMQTIRERGLDAGLLP